MNENHRVHNIHHQTILNRWDFRVWTKIKKKIKNERKRKRKCMKRKRFECKQWILVSFYMRSNFDGIQCISIYRKKSTFNTFNTFCLWYLRKHYWYKKHKSISEWVRARDLEWEKEKKKCEWSRVNEEVK